MLAGEAGVALAPVLTAEPNTGIGSPAQCVFHATVRPGRNGVPGKITDIVAVNTGGAPLTGINTITVWALVRP